MALIFMENSFIVINFLWWWLVVDERIVPRLENREQVAQKVRLNNGENHLAALGFTVDGAVDRLVGLQREKDLL